MSYFSKAVLPLAAVAAIGFGSAALARTVNLTGTFATENMAKTAPTGDVTATLNTVTGALKYTITYGGLSGDVLAAHFHGPAAPGKDAGILVPIPGPYHSGMTGMVTVKATTVKTLLAGMTYVNLHTKLAPMGEARAQMTVAK